MIKNSEELLQERLKNLELEYNKIRQLLDDQNKRLFLVAKERDNLLSLVRLSRG